jgi:hypothetical protein
MPESNYDVAILLASRGRTESLLKSVTSMVINASIKSKIQFIFAFDQDDYLGFAYFNEVVKPWIKEKNINYRVMLTERYGYHNLSKYYNQMAFMANADWYFMWNDDAIMDTKGWDRVIASKTGEFKILSIHTHNEHPYSIFPIVPKSWPYILGLLAKHHMFDSEISQLAYYLDIIEKVEIYATHDRADLTGNNQDATYKERILLDKDPTDPRDINSKESMDYRNKNLTILYEFMKFNKFDVSWFESILNGTNKDPFRKLRENDPNKLVNINLRT